MKKIILLLLIGFSVFCQTKKDTIEIEIKYGTKIKTQPQSTINAKYVINNTTEKIKAFDFIDSFYKVLYKNEIGYIQESWVNDNIDTYKFKDKIKEEWKKEELIRLQEQVLLEQKEVNKLELEQKIIDQKNIKKYGKETYNKLKKGLFWIGMTKEMAILSLGYPNDINKTVTRTHISEQWVYTNTYLYFENGILESYQN